MDSFKVLEVKQSIFENNDADAKLLREQLRRDRTFLLNLMSSPGSGKTTTLMAVIARLKDKLRIGVMEADIDSDVDARTIEGSGAKVIQLHTGGMCHLDADMTRQGLAGLGADDIDLAILDADLTGPSIPKAFGVSERMRAAADHMLPVTTPSGIQMVSMNLLLDAPEEPVLWRGPVIAGVVAQFWSEVMWDDVDYMFIDLPPGTGDVPLTVTQGLPLDGIVIVSSPQDLVGMIVEKAVKMARMMKVPVLSLVENMSYFICPDCGKVHEIFGESKVQKLAAIYGIDAFIRLPINPDSARLVDEGRVRTSTATMSRRSRTLCSDDIKQKTLPHRLTSQPVGELSMRVCYSAAVICPRR